MNKIIKVILISLMFVLLIPCAVSATQKDLAISNLIILEDKKIEDPNCGDITVVLGSTDVQSDVNGSVIVVFGKATINGNVSGDVVSAFGEVYIKGDSQVQGNLVSVGKLEKAKGVSINGAKLLIDVDFISLFKSNGIIINTLIICSILILIAGLILITIFTDRYRVMSYSMKLSVVRPMILGGLVLISFTIVLIFLIFLVIAPIFFVLFIMFADIIASIYLGTIIFKNNYERSAIYLEFFVGHIIISILKIVPLIILPAGSYLALMIYGICFIILEVLMISFGIGTAIDTGFGKKKLNKPQ